MLADRVLGLLLVVLISVASFCDSAPAVSEASDNGSAAHGAALAIVQPGLVHDKEHKHTADNATSTSEVSTTKPTPKSETNSTATDHNVTKTTTAPEAAGTTVHSGDAVLHFGSGVDTVKKKPQHPTYFFSSWITWREDNYLMSILIPIACGVAAAVLILCSLACIGCCRRRCRSRNRRNLHRKIDPKTFRKMKAADRIKLLAASSDEEF